MARAPAPPKDLPGWRLVSGKLVEDRTVNGCIARGEVILARCKTDQCRRQVTVDLIAYQKIGFGKTEISEVQKAWSCGAGRCELSWVHGQYPAGVPLQCYIGAQCTVRVQCENCGRVWIYTPEAMLEQLTRRGAADGNISVLKIAKAIRGACPSCRRVAWKADLVWDRAHGQGGFHADPMPKRA